MADNKLQKLDIFNIQLTSLCSSKHQTLNPPHSFSIFKYILCNGCTKKKEKRKKNVLGVRISWKVLFEWQKSPASNFSASRKVLLKWKLLMLFFCSLFFSFLFRHDANATHLDTIRLFLLLFYSFLSCCVILKTHNHCSSHWMPIEKAMKFVIAFNENVFYNIFRLFFV
jgi:hypothetical protein